jgi:DNA invertase Pin-like site-specific DNA recombinase
MSIDRRGSSSVPRTVRCAIYTRKSSEEGLEQSFNSLDAQRDACEAYIASQKHEGWRALSQPYDDGGFSGGSMERPALKRLLDDIGHGHIDVVVVYKVDRLTRALADFAKLTDLFDRHGTSFVSVTQQFNTSTSMGRLTLNVLLSFAQFERELAGERIRDKIALSKRRGLWAHRWFDDLTSGRATTIAEIAQRDHQQVSKISRTLPLAFLAPDIVTLIVEGRQPPSLTVERLTQRHRPLPMDWAEQRVMLL